MTHALALLLLALAGADSPSAKAAVPLIVHEEIADGPQPVPLRSAEAVAKLCAALEPPERLRLQGDAVARGEAEAEHDRARGDAILGRYEVDVPAAKLAFAPYQKSERRLSLKEGEMLALFDGKGRLWTATERGLPVEVDPESARRIVASQRLGRLELGLVFDLVDDATCGMVSAGRVRTLAIDPVSWRWHDGPTLFARGGAGADRPLATAADGAVPRVSVGEPIAGSGEARRAVVARIPALQACYADALRRNPSLDGVLVADLGGAEPAIAADSVGDADLAGCVRLVLGADPGKAVVPIRFELVAPPGAAQPAPGR